MNEGHGRALRIACIVSLGGFLFGFDASVISGVITFIVPRFGLSDLQLGLVVGAPTLAGMIAALTAAPLADRIGRRPVLLILAALYTVSAVASALAPSYEVLVAARFLGGLAFASLGIAPMYIGEIAPAKRRGFMVSVNQMNIMIGFSVAYFANYFMLEASQSSATWVAALGIDAHAWRWMLGVEAIPALVWFLFLLRVPESPRYLVLRERVSEARDVLASIRPASVIREELKEIQLSVGDAATRRYHPRELLHPSLRLCLMVGFLVAIAQQVTGINAIYFYAPSIFEQSGVGTNAAFAQATLIGIINIVATAIAMVLIDRMGRRPLLLFGLVGIILSTALVGYGFQQASYELRESTIAALELPVDRAPLEELAGMRFDSDLEFKRAMTEAIGADAMRAHSAVLIQAAIEVDARLVLAGILGFVFSFALSLGPVMWVLFSEIFPNRVRGLAMGVTGFANSLSSFLVQFIFPWELSNLGIAMTFFIFSAAGLLFLVPLARLLPETRGHSLEAVEALFSGRRNAGQPVPEIRP
ncbi:MAG: MFS transporter [Pseudomonadota bacterium]